VSCATAPVVPSATISPSSPPVASAAASPTPTATSRPASAAPQPSTSPTASPQPVVHTWRAVPAQHAISATRFSDVLWTGARFIAIGSDQDEHGVILDSTDGIQWHEQADLAKGWFASGLRMEGATVVVSGAVGTRPALWRSPDGLAWTGDERPPARLEGAVDIVQAPSGWVAVGSELSDGPCASECNPVRGLVWTSPDGVTWTRSPNQRSLLSATLTGVVRAGDRYVAGGYIGGGAAMWDSPDGVTWTRLRGTVFDHETSSVILDLASRGDIVVAVGTTGIQDFAPARAWWKSGVDAWVRGKIELGDLAQLTRVTATDVGFTAVGASDPSRCRGAIWSSVDGRSWRCTAKEAAFKDFGPTAWAASPSVEVVVGTRVVSSDGESDDVFSGAIFVRDRP
jgi:hypothetical protein